MHKLFLVAAATAAIGGCASRADNIEAAYVSPLSYRALSCADISAEARRVSARAGEMFRKQNHKAATDAALAGGAALIFWPAAFFIKGEGASAANVAQIKGQMRALEQASAAQGCDLRFDQRNPQRIIRK